MNFCEKCGMESNQEKYCNNCGEHRDLKEKEDNSCSTGLESQLTELNVDLQETQENQTLDLKSILQGLLLAIAVTAILFFFIPELIIAVFIVRLFSIACGSWVAGKKAGRKGWLNGGLVGVSHTIIVHILAAIFWGYVIRPIDINHVLIGFLVGAISGAIGERWPQNDSSPKNPFAIWGFVCVIIGSFLTVIIIDILFLITGIFLSIIGLKGSIFKNLAIAGIIIGVLGILGTIIIFLEEPEYYSIWLAR